MHEMTGKAANMQIEQRAYIDAMKRADLVSNRYGNQRKVRRAAKAHLERTLATIGYSAVAIEVVWKDAFDMYLLERDCENSEAA